MDKDLLFAFVFIALQIGLIVLPSPLKPKPKDTHATETTHSTHWGYEGTVGPEYWGDISPEYQTCKTGDAQTPINIDSTKVVKTTTKEFGFSYLKSPLHIVNNGHTIQVNYAPGSFATYKNTKYQLAQFHFHVPSEHTINGKAWPMNVHLVHKDESGNLLVVEVLFAEGRANAELAKIMDHLPKPNEELTVEGSEVNAAALLPSQISYYHYEGSLTTPPCTEGVQWFVLRNPIEVAREDVDAFKVIYPMNARPVQPVHDRVISEF